METDAALYFIVENDRAVSCASPRGLIDAARRVCGDKGTPLNAFAAKTDETNEVDEAPEALRAAASRALAQLASFSVFRVERREGAVGGDGLAALFDFYLDAQRRGLAAAAENQIDRALGQPVLIQVKRLVREAVGCHLFYDPPPD